MYLLEDRESVSDDRARFVKSSKPMTERERDAPDDPDVAQRPTAADAPHERPFPADLDHVVDAAPARQLAHLGVPVAVRAVVDGAVHAELVACAGELGVRRRGDDDAAARGERKLGGVTAKR